MEKIIVSRHKGAVKWLKLHGVKASVINHATTEDVRGKHVFGNLPLHLAAEAKMVTIISLPQLKPEQRGKDLIPIEMDAAGAVLESYVVQRIQHPHREDT